MKKRKKPAVDDLVIRCILIRGRGQDTRYFGITIDETNYQALGHALAIIIAGSNPLGICDELASGILKVDLGGSPSFQYSNNEVDIIIAKQQCTIIIPFQGPEPDCASETTYFPFEIVRDVVRIFIAFIRHNASLEL